MLNINELQDLKGDYYQYLNQLDESFRNSTESKRGVRTDNIFEFLEHSINIIKSLETAVSKNIPNQLKDKISIFVCGSYGRLEAFSKHSDADFFIVFDDDLNTPSQEMHNQLLNLIGFIMSKFSDLGIKIHDNKQISGCKNIDDIYGSIWKNNLFYSYILKSWIIDKNETDSSGIIRRLSILLESQCIYNKVLYNKILDDLSSFYELSKEIGFHELLDSDIDRFGMDFGHYTLFKKFKEKKNPHLLDAKLHTSRQFFIRSNLLFIRLNAKYLLNERDDFFKYLTTPAFYKLLLIYFYQYRYKNKLSFNKDSIDIFYQKLCDDYNEFLFYLGKFRTLLKHNEIDPMHHDIAVKFTLLGQSIALCFIGLYEHIDINNECSMNKYIDIEKKK